MTGTVVFLLGLALGVGSWAASAGSAHIDMIIEKMSPRRLFRLLEPLAGVDSCTAIGRVRVV